MAGSTFWDKYLGYKLQLRENSLAVFVTKNVTANDLESK
jgi:hypothetical protein